MVTESSDGVIFLLMVFVAALLLASSFIVPVFGENSRSRKRLQKRVQAICETGRGSLVMLRSEQLGERNGLEQRLRDWPGLDRLGAVMGQAGLRMRPERLVLIALSSAVAGGVAALLLHLPLLVLPVAVIAPALVPFIVVAVRRTKRLARFEEQFPDAIGVMTRALRAGHPFNDALRLVSEEMTDPVSGEFRTTFADLNYGGDVRVALAHLLERVPTVTVLAFITAVLVQRETGGNLAEILDQLGETIRGRFRFARRVKTLSAEARMSAWILVLVPFVLVIALSIVNPNYIPMLTKNSTGIKLIGAAFMTMLTGIVWMRRIIRIEV